MMTGDIHPRSFSAMHHVSRVTWPVIAMMSCSRCITATSRLRVTRLCMTVTRHGTDESGGALIKVKLSISVSSLVSDESLLRLTKNNSPPPRPPWSENESCRECRVPRVWDRTEAASVTELVTT